LTRLQALFSILPCLAELSKPGGAIRLASVAGPEIEIVQDKTCRWLAQFGSWSADRRVDPMRFLEVLRQLLTRVRAPAASEERGAGGSEEAFGQSEESSEDLDPQTYDRARWRKRLQRILDELPGSRGEWPDLLADARDLGLSEDWVRECQVDEFLLLARRSVKDRILNERALKRLDCARELMRLSRDQADSAIRSIVAEAEAFFGKPVQGT